MDIIKFEHFIKVCEAKSLTKAAEELFIMQPALSQSITYFEDFWGHKLFDRSSKRLQLNEKGRIALEYSYSIMNCIDSLRRKLDSIDSNKDTLTIYSVDMNILFYIISGFLIENPYISLRQVEDRGYSCEEMLLTKKADVVITTDRSLHPEIDNFLLMVDTQYVLTPKGSALYQVPSASLMDFVDCEFIRGTSHEDKIMSALIDKYLAEKRPPLGLVHYVDRQISSRMKSKSGYHSFVTWFSFYNLNFTYDPNRYSLVWLTDPEFKIPYYISCLKDRSPAAGKFRGWVSEHYKLFFANKKKDFQRV